MSPRRLLGVVLLGWRGLAVARPGTCQLCRASDPTWYAPNDLWNAVVARLHATTAMHLRFCCPSCFILLVNVLEVADPPTWRLVPDVI